MSCYLFFSVSFPWRMHRIAFFSLSPFMFLKKFLFKIFLSFSIMSSGVFVSAAINDVRHVYSVSSYSTLNPIIFDQNGAKNIS
uniref:Uncharacterized protein n=1 Tax=Manihot esculenta TaxID=3983 RepID=A0A199UAU7_MANES